MAPATRVAVWDRLSCPFRGFGGAALARARFGEEAWDIVNSGMKRTLATFMRIAFEATLHRILHAICAKILLDFAIQNHEKMLLRGLFLWLAL